MTNPHQFLQDQIDDLDRVLPIQAPLNDFVHFNPLMNYDSIHFAEAQREVHQQTGALCYLSADEYRENFNKGRITVDDLQAVFKDAKNFTYDEEFFQAGNHLFKNKDIYLTALTQNIKDISYRKLLWKIEVDNAVQQFQADIPEQAREQLLFSAEKNEQHSEKQALSALWKACLQHFGAEEEPKHYNEFVDLSLLQIWQRIEEKIQTHGQVITTKKLILEKSKKIKLKLFDQVGKTITLRSLLKHLTDTDILEEIQPTLIRQLSTWLDLGISTQKEEHTQGFYAFWKEMALKDINPYFDGLITWYDYVESLSDDPLETIETELMRIGIPQEDWNDYLKCLALEMPGWSGMFNWREKNKNYSGVTTQVAMADYLAVRLTLEHLFCRHITREHWQIDATLPDLRGYFAHNLNEFFVRHYTYNEELPEYLQSISDQLLTSSKNGISAKKWHEISHLMLTWLLITEYIIDTKSYTNAWRLFHAAQHLGLCADEIASLKKSHVDKLLDLLHELDDPNTSGYLWLQAYEHNYNEAILNAIIENHDQGNWPDRETKRPRAQIIFCMDDREESIRRHLEEVAPDVETIGAAGVFGLPNNWKAISAKSSIKLAQPVVTAVHQFNEVADESISRDAVEKYQSQQESLNNIKTLKSHGMRQGLFNSALSLPIAAGLGLSELLGRSFFPARYQHISKAIAGTIYRPLKTRVDATATKVLETPTLEHNQIGLSETEKVEKVAAYLKLTGFTKGYSRLVVLMAHSAKHTNNPHILAYGCGACSGRFGGPNARAFVGIANTPKIRQQLAEKHDINIPEDCWFLAGEHETTGDYIEYFDTDLIPTSHQEEFVQLQKDVAEANQNHAQERCRKFASAPKASPQESHRHVQGRAAAPSQIRAELGHQGCAVAFIGRRSMHQGVFWDRRPFLVSYDPFNDPEGKMLEAQLLGNGVVGLGIAFDYYYSRIQNGYLGSGNKATHNIAGLFGVMDGSCSDLQTGLARQMTELHEPMRLLVVLEADLATVGDIYHRQPAIRNLVDNEWLVLAVKNPNTAEIQQFKVGTGFVRWEGKSEALPELKQSRNEYADEMGYLPPSRIVTD